MGSGADTTVCDDCVFEDGCNRPVKYTRLGCPRYGSKEGVVPSALGQLNEALWKDDRVTYATPKDPSGADEPEFSLDKLIDDHWEYVEATLLTHGVDNCDIEIAEYHYKTAAKHFWKHACEHYGIEEKK